MAKTVFLHVKCLTHVPYDLDFPQLVDFVVGIVVQRRVSKISLDTASGLSPNRGFVLCRPKRLRIATLLHHVTPTLRVFPALTVDELSFSRGECDASDDADKLRSSRDCATPGEGSSSPTCIWRFRHDLVHSQRKMAAGEHRYIHDIDKSQKSVPSMTSKRSLVCMSASWLWVSTHFTWIMGVKVDLVKVDRVIVALAVRRTLQKSPQRLRPLTTRRGGHLEVLAHLPVLLVQLVPLLLLDAGCQSLVTAHVNHRPRDWRPHLSVLEVASPKVFCPPTSQQTESTPPHHHGLARRGKSPCQRQAPSPSSPPGSAFTTC